MLSSNDSSSEADHPSEGAEAAVPNDLLRSSHIFASVVQDIVERKLLDEVSPTRLTLTQFRLLRVISVNGGYQVGEMANFLGVSPPAATKTVDKLEGLGLLVRTPCKRDRRVTLVNSSLKGRRLVQRYEELRRSRLGPVLEDFSAAEVGQLTVLLDRFTLGVLSREDISDSLCLRCSAYCDDACPVRPLLSHCPCDDLRETRSREQSP
jgi:DNA-binding MarR family transcriptional regulator